MQLPRRKGNIPAVARVAASGIADMAATCVDVRGASGEPARIALPLTARPWAVKMDVDLVHLKLQHNNNDQGLHGRRNAGSAQQTGRMMPWADETDTMSDS
jgi:hypothetical protein